MGEDSIWEEFRHGNSSVLGVLFAKYSDSMFAYGMKFTADREMVKDAIQEVFCRLLNAGGRLGDARNVKGYLLCALRHELIRQLSRSKFLSFSDNPLVFDMTADDDALNRLQNGEDEEEQQLLRRLLEAVGQLSARQKEAIYLRYIQEVPVSDIAGIMGISYQSTRNVLHKAMLKLREQLGSGTPLASSTLVALLLQVFAPLHP